MHLSSLCHGEHTNILPEAWITKKLPCSNHLGYDKKISFIIQDLKFVVQIHHSGGLAKAISCWGKWSQWWLPRARCFPLPNSPGQVKLPVGQVDLNRLILFISYKQIEEFQNSWSWASDDFEKRQALVPQKFSNVIIIYSTFILWGSTGYFCT